MTYKVNQFTVKNTGTESIGVQIGGGNIVTVESGQTMVALPSNDDLVSDITDAVIDTLYKHSHDLDDVVISDIKHAVAILLEYHTRII